MDDKIFKETLTSLGVTIINNDKGLEFILPTFRKTVKVIGTIKQSIPEENLTALEKKAYNSALSKHHLYYKKKTVAHSRLYWSSPCKTNKDHALDGKTYRCSGQCLMCKKGYEDVTVENIEAFAKGFITRRDLGL